MATANLQLLGKTIRSFRERVPPDGLSQFRLALLMNWEGTAPIVEIEKGRRLPRPETLNALGEALQLSPADLAYLHGLAGYREVTVLPPREQIIRVLLALEPDLARRRFPVYVLDYRFRFWMINGAAAALQPPGHTARLRPDLDGVTMTFDSRLPFHRPPPDGDAQERDAVLRFKTVNLYRRHEPFYLAFVGDMRARLLPEDFARFEHCWRETDVDSASTYPLAPRLLLNIGPQVLDFEIHMVEIPQLNHTLFAAYYEPVDDDAGNRARCEQFFVARGASEWPTVRVWEMAG
jgi:transcriptional regulator with XRE-family HTH domain